MELSCFTAEGAGINQNGEIDGALALLQGLLLFLTQAGGALLLQACSSVVPSGFSALAALPGVDGITQLSRAQA